MRRKCLHIGRIGLRDETGEGEPLLLDWRAPAARPFYVATAGAPHGVRRRRHIAMRGRQVTGLDDEVLDREDPGGTSGLTGEAALLAALDAKRTGRMHDIVGTLQAEQDAIIRSAPSGILVVQGGPGTGKTAVALHRAAYLLYTHPPCRARRARGGPQRDVPRVWPALTPQRLLDDLFASPARLTAAAPALTAAERAALLRKPGGWSTADVPLLDEAAELLGQDERAAQARSARERAQRIAYAQGVLDIAAGSGGCDGEALRATDLLNAEEIAERHEASSRLTVAERAAADRTWTFGHVIVDEAQELSEMAWRLLARRCPGKSMTVVGDAAQTSGPAGTTSWEQVLEPLAGDRWRLARLAVNYRTPAEIMAATTALLDAIDPGQPPPRSVCETGVPPWRMATTRGALPAALAEITVAEAASAGHLAIIVPDDRAAELGHAVSRVVSLVSRLTETGMFSVNRWRA